MNDVEQIEVDDDMDFVLDNGIKVDLNVQGTCDIEVDVEEREDGVPEGYYSITDTVLDQYEVIGVYDGEPDEYLDYILTDEEFRRLEKEFNDFCYHNPEVNRQGEYFANEALEYDPQERWEQLQYEIDRYGC